MEEIHHTAGIYALGASSNSVVVIVIFDLKQMNNHHKIHAASTSLASASIAAKQRSSGENCQIDGENFLLQSWTNAGYYIWTISVTSSDLRSGRLPNLYIFMQRHLHTT